MPSTVLDAFEGLEINLSTTEQCLETKRERTIRSVLSMETQISQLCDRDGVLMFQEAQFDMCYYSHEKMSFPHYLFYLHLFKKLLIKLKEFKEKMKRSSETNLL